MGTYWQLGTRPDELRQMRHPALRAAAGSIDARALVPPSGPRTETMFVQLAPEATGVRTENRYNDSRMRASVPMADLRIVRQVTQFDVVG